MPPLANSDRHELEQLRVKLAGCAVAALGGLGKGQIAKPYSYGWSPAYADVLLLRIAFEKIAGGRTPQQVIDDDGAAV